MIIDPVQLLFIIPGFALSMWASMRVKSTFQRFSQVRARSGMSGAEAARELLRQKGIHDVRVESVSGFLSDHYDPGARVLRLSSDVYNGRSLAALGVAAHEAGHAIQHATNYGPLGFRSAIVKPAGIGSSLGMYISIFGILFQWQPMIWIGIVLFSAFVLFTLVTLPVEFDASSRAVAVLQQSGMIAPDEAPGAKAVLNAAALTYVAAAAAAILQLLYLLMRAGVLGGNDD
ncbi:MAG: zinc metallopeptidase [Myxococcales bacterium]|jgi:Zn-dependent membrane protease YugP